MMNCDHVFDVLTRGPFPAGGADDNAVLAHLDQCPSCHRLAEALRPALELFEEATSVEESCDLPGFWGELPQRTSDPRRDRGFARIAKLPTTMNRRATPREVWFKRRGDLPLWRFAASIMMIAGGLLVVLAARPSNEGRPPVPTCSLRPPSGRIPTMRRSCSSDRAIRNEWR